MPPPQPSPAPPLRVFRRGRVGEGAYLNRRTRTLQALSASVVFSFFNNPHATGSSEMTMISIVTMPKLFLMMGTLPNRKPPQMKIVIQAKPPAKL